MFDLREFGFHDDRVAVAFSVVLGENVEGVIVAVFADQVSGTFRDEPRFVLIGVVGIAAGSVLHHRHDLDHGGRNLKQRWDSPCPVG